MGGSTKLTADKSKGLSETTWTILEVAGSALVIGGLVLFSGSDPKEPPNTNPSIPVEKPSVTWTDVITIP